MRTERMRFSARSVNKHHSMASNYHWQQLHMPVSMVTRNRHMDNLAFAVDGHIHAMLIVCGLPSIENDDATLLKASQLCINR